MNILLVGIGGAVGAMLRYGCVVAGARLIGTGLPWGVFFANVVGSLVIGFAAAFLLERAGTERIELFLMPGLLGGFTTFSAYSLDVVRLFDDGRVGEAILYAAASVALALAAAAAGIWLGRAVA